MQFIEKNSFNIRAAVYRLKNSRDNLEFLLFPMIHIGDQNYYEEVQKRLMDCQYIIYEGVKSFRGALLTWSYRFTSKRKRLGLITQRDGLKLHELKSKLLHSDISQSEFDKSWSQLPLKLRLLLIFVVPFFSLYLFLFATRSFIAKNLCLEDLPTRDEIIHSDDDFDKLDKLLGTKRDKIIMNCIEQEYLSKKKMDVQIGVIYGAKHIVPIIKFLMAKYGFKVVKAEWITVFNINQIQRM
jgi:hypothetical protein